MQRISLIEPDAADPSAKRIMENLLKQLIEIDKLIKNVKN